MPSTTPDDLAVTFHSLARRRAEAIGDANPAALSGLLNELQRHVDAAAATIGSGSDAESIAAAIEARPSEQWDEAMLDQLRAHALDAGAALRRLAVAAGSDSDDD